MQFHSATNQRFLLLYITATTLIMKASLIISALFICVSVVQSLPLSRQTRQTENIDSLKAAFKSAINGLNKLFVSAKIMHGQT